MFGKTKESGNLSNPVKIIREQDKLPWVDKYRPKNINDVIHQEEVIKVLKQTLATGQLPHMIFYGPSGTGKTSSILAATYQLFGPKIHKDRVKELNASDERGINIVRYKINTFAKMAIGNADPLYPSPPYKIIILDEADAMTTEAQSALRKVMEEFSGITRFCFICNYINQIIDPIASRCMKFRFKPIQNNTMLKKLKEIAVKESFRVDDDIMKTITEISKGDVRKAIMTLQNLKYVYNYKKEVSKEDLYNITSYVPLYRIKPLWDKLIMKKKNLEVILEDIDKFRANGYPVTSIMEQLQELIVNDKMSDMKKAQLCIQLGNTEKRLIDGADEYIQLINVCSYIHGVLNNEINFISKNIC
jgi:replication factor C subunit 2/4